MGLAREKPRKRHNLRRCQPPLTWHNTLRRIDKSFFGCGIPQFSRRSKPHIGRSFDPCILCICITSVCICRKPRVGSKPCIGRKQKYFNRGQRNGLKKFSRTHKCFDKLFDKLQKEFFDRDQRRFKLIIFFRFTQLKFKQP